MKAFVEPVIEIENFEIADVITASIDQCPNELGLA